MQEEPTIVSNPTPPRRSLNLGGQLPLIIALLIIGGLLLTWKPWQTTSKAADRTVTVTGEAEITAEPDEYVFNPQYETKNTDKQTALKASTDQTNAVVSELKKLGVADSKIKTDTSGYRNYYSDNSDTYYAYLTVTVGDKKLAQKVQDYLLTTSPSGSVTPQANFSKAKRKQLESQGRDQATKDARAKAEQSATNLGFKIGKVKSVKDGNDDSTIRPYAAEGLSLGANAASDAKASSPIQQGEDDLSYQVTVTYFVR